jgi:hypothetical protein
MQGTKKLMSCRESSEILRKIKSWTFPTLLTVPSSNFSSGNISNLTPTHCDTFCLNQGNDDQRNIFLDFNLLWVKTKNLSPSFLQLIPEQGKILTFLFLVQVLFIRFFPESL